MTGFLIPFLLRRGYTPAFAAKLSKVAFFAGTAALLALAAWAAIAIHDRRVIDRHEDHVAATLAPKVTAGAEAAASQRAVDTIRIAHDEQEMTNAVAALPDAAPSRRRNALNCARMRRAGADTSGIAACR